MAERSMLVCITLIVFTLSNVYGNMCPNRIPKKDFKNEDISEKYYIIALNKVFHIQLAESDCGIAELKYLEDDKWNIDIKYQFKNGSIGNALYKIIDTEPAGHFEIYQNKNDDDDIISHINILGAETNQYTVVSACNSKNGDEGIWIGYKERVNGFDSIDDETKNKINEILKRNNIDVKQLTNVDNTNCNSN